MKTIEETIAWFEGRVKSTTMPGARSMFEVAISALRAQQERENPKPLTLDELRQMDGEPVWMQPNSPPKCGKWAIVAGVDTEYGEKTLYLEGDFTCRDYGKTWLAYRHKPKEV